MRFPKYKITLLAALFWGVFLGVISIPSPIDAADIDELKQKIKDNNAQIEKIQNEIKQIQNDLQSNAKESSNIKSKISELEKTKKKLIADINLTQSQIKSAELNIEKLGLEINLKNSDIKSKKDSLTEFIRNINDSESATMLEIILSRDEFSDFFGNFQRMEDFQEKINENLSEVKKLKSDLEVRKKQKEDQKDSLENLKDRYGDQKKLIEQNKGETDKLLQETKNKETVYKKLLADRLAKQQAFEEEIRELEAEIRLAIDRDALPPTGKGILKWPLDKIRITQYFGNTEFALANASLYNGGGHNGVDFGASIGTPVKAARDGVVAGVGDTDAACYGVSYGKWVLVKHSNNLSTLYAHLSLIKVSTGQQVDVGQVLGYSGDTGYATGPHLHFGVFATEGVEIQSYKSKICGTTMILPVKTKKNAYLNPLDYL